MKEKLLEFGVFSSHLAIAKVNGGDLVANTDFTLKNVCSVFFTFSWKDLRAHTKVISTLNFHLSF